MFILQGGPMGGQALALPEDDTLLRHQVDVGRDGSAGLERGLDPALEVPRHARGVLQQDLEDVVADEVQVFFRVEAEHLDDGRGVEFDG